MKISKNRFNHFLKSVLVVLVLNLSITQGIVISENSIVQVSAPRPHLNGRALVSAFGDTLDLRGVNWGWWGIALQADAAECVVMGVKTVRMPFRWYFTGEGSDIRDTTAPGNISPDGLADLDAYLSWCEAAGLSVILFGGSDQGAGDNNRNFWTDQLIKQQFITAWKFLASRYKSNKAIIAFEVLSEPHPKKPATNTDLRNFYREVIDSIRTVDQNTPLIIGPNDHYDLYQLDSVYLPERNDIFYTFNYYLPTSYVKIEKQEEIGLPPYTYPGLCPDNNNKEIMLDSTWLESTAALGANFGFKHNVPVFVNQVGVRSRCPGSLDYTSDVLSALTNNGLGWSWWTFRTNKKDSTDHGLYWLDPDNKQLYHRKDSLGKVLVAELARPFPSASVNVISISRQRNGVLSPCVLSKENHGFVIRNAVGFERVQLFSLAGKFIREARIINGESRLLHIPNGVYITILKGQGTTFQIAPQAVTKWPVTK